MMTAHHDMKQAQSPTNDHNCPLSKSTNDEEHTHPRPAPTTTQNEYDCPRTTTADLLTMWDVHPNDPQTMTTHHTKWAWPPTNNMNCPPSRQNPSCPQMTTMTHKTTTHNPQKATSDEEHPLQPLPTTTRNGHNHTRKTRSTHPSHPWTTAQNRDKWWHLPTANPPAMRSAHSNKWWPPSMTLNGDDHPWMMTTAKPLNDEECTSTAHKQQLPITQNMHDHPWTTCQQHGMSTPITHTGVHALHPSYWLSDPHKAAQQCPLTLALCLWGSWVISGAITPHGLGYLWVFVNPLPIPAKTHACGHGYRCRLLY